METDDISPMTYEQAVGAHVQRYKELLSTPIPWGIHPSSLGRV